MRAWWRQVRPAVVLWAQLIGLYTAAVIAGLLQLT